jgi:hypothetical protein
MWLRPNSSKVVYADFFAGQIVSLGNTLLVGPVALRRFVPRVPGALVVVAVSIALTAA